MRDHLLDDCPPRRHPLNPPPTPTSIGPLVVWRTTRGDGDEITVDWRHEDDGEIGFTAGPAVRLRFPTTAYLEAVRALDRELMDATGQRVEELERRGGLPGVDLNLVQLRREHEDRRRWLSRNLDRLATTDWAVVRHGAHLLLGHGRRTDTRTG
ncbi:DUF5984 family protein [Micromonospora sp. WMMA1998]|uniref:DUF5984 family protein n=1 Tax=Micromonospora sp. WMMA1998 TaxID=3015167 RepID=UPI00248B691D|nr:DUF5984 family protein [Micromonospora sp. WMMA1998]WBC14898.1 DUF5984 family protein [Micromonospora sp. WMMA1998]